MLDKFIERKPHVQTFVKRAPVLFLHQWSMNMVVIKGSKAVLIQKLSMQCNPLSPDVAIIVAQQFLYRVAWPCGGCVGLLFFDRYNVCWIISKWSREATLSWCWFTTFNLEMNCSLTGHKAHLQHEINKRCMSRHLCTFALGFGVSVTNHYNGIINYLFQATPVD